MTAPRHPVPIAGWDVGGVNIKMAVVRDGTVVHASTRPFEIQRAPDALSWRLREAALAAGLAVDRADAVPHAVTMTAELSQMFRSKREGVSFVLAAVGQAFPRGDVHVATVDGDFLRMPEAAARPLDVAAANWAATARVAAWSHADALLIDIGTTTTDIIPIAGGAPAGQGRTDPERLAAGELVYTGAVRTPVEAIIRSVPWRGRRTRVSAEGFALAGDVHVWRGDLQPEDYTAPTPDGRPATRPCAGERLARVICADREMLDEDAVSAIADAVAAAQRRIVAAAIACVRRRHPRLRRAVVTGAGAFLAEAAARMAGMTPERLAWPGEPAAAAAVALLLERRLRA